MLKVIITVLAVGGPAILVEPGRNSTHLPKALVSGFHIFTTSRLDPGNTCSTNMVLGGGSFFCAGQCILGPCEYREEKDGDTTYTFCECGGYQPLSCHGIGITVTNEEEETEWNTVDCIGSSCAASACQQVITQHTISCCY